MSLGDGRRLESSWQVVTIKRESHRRVYCYLTTSLPVCCLTGDLTIIHITQPTDIHLQHTTVGLFAVLFFFLPQLLISWSFDECIFWVCLVTVLVLNTTAVGSFCRAVVELLSSCCRAVAPAVFRKLKGNLLEVCTKVYSPFSNVLINIEPRMTDTHRVSTSLGTCHCLKVGHSIALRTVSVISFFG